MAVPSYTTDLTTIVDYDGTTGTAAEPSTGWTAGRSPINNDTDFPIQGSTHASETMNTTGKCGLLTTGSTFTWTSGNYLFAWLIWLAPGAIATRANGGLALLCGSSTSAYKVFYVGGSDFGSYPYGGWQNFAVDPTMTYDEVFGSPSGYYVVGVGANVLSAVSKGNPLGNDAIRYGRGAFRVAGGQSGNYATFSGMAAANDASAAKWGLFQAIEGGYKFKGLMYLGYGALTAFVDANKNIVIDNAIYVQSNFNRIEIHNASSSISWTNISIAALGTVSKGQFEVIDNATVSLDSCTFTDMSTFIFQSNGTLINTTFRRCGQVTQGGASFETCLFTNSTAAAALLCDSLGGITDCSFISAGTGHAIQGFSTVNGTYDVSDLTFSGYASSDGTTGNEALYVTAASGTTTINYSGTAPSVRSAGATISKVSGQVTLTISAPVSLVGAEVRIYDLDGSTGYLGTELDGVESNGSATFAFTGTASNVIWIQIMLDGYVEFGQQTTMPTSNGSFVAQLVKETNE